MNKKSLRRWIRELTGQNVDLIKENVDLNMKLREMEQELGDKSSKILELEKRDAWLNEWASATNKEVLGARDQIRGTQRIIGAIKAEITSRTISMDRMTTRIVELEGMLAETEHDNEVLAEQRQHMCQECREISGLRFVHQEKDCVGRYCVVHNRSLHHMRTWPLRWHDGDFAMAPFFERICPHGHSHPDPDQVSFWKLRGITGRGIHACDGCCSIEYSG